MQLKLIAFGDKEYKDCGLKQFTVNDKVLLPAEIRAELLRADGFLRNFLEEKYGFLGKAQINKDHLYLGFLTMFEELNRPSHISIRLPDLKLTKWSLTFNLRKITKKYYQYLANLKQGEAPLYCRRTVNFEFYAVPYTLHPDKALLRKEIIQIARVLLKLSFPGNLALHNNSRELLLKEIGFDHPLPKTLLELANRRLPSI